MNCTWECSEELRKKLERFIQPDWKLVKETTTKEAGNVSVHLCINRNDSSYLKLRKTPLTLFVKSNKTYTSIVDDIARIAEFDLFLEQFPGKLCMKNVKTREVKIVKRWKRRHYVENENEEDECSE